MSTDIISLLNPLHDVLLVRRDPGQEKIGTIYLSDSSQLGRSQTGVVEKCGDLAQYYLGRRIIFGMNAGMSPKVGGGEQEVVILRPSDVVGVIDDQPKIPVDPATPKTKDTRFVDNETDTVLGFCKSPVFIRGDVIQVDGVAGIFKVIKTENWYGMEICRVSQILSAEETGK